jgi:hypothetical protein
MGYVAKNGIVSVNGMKGRSWGIFKNRHGRAEENHKKNHSKQRVLKPP